MNVLFVSSGNNKFGISSIVLNQGQSLQSVAIDVDYYVIKGKGIIGYLQNIPTLRKKVKQGNFQLIHAHYSFSGIVAALGFLGLPLVVSLMGSDSKMSVFWRLIIKFFSLFFWSKVIVKSEDMKLSLGLKHAEVIPNGVDFTRFIPMPKSNAREALGLDSSKKYILFLSNPDRYEKNFVLTKEAFALLRNNNAELLVVHGKSHQEVAQYLYAADVLISTSIWEGSPNAIKEAMSCNLPIVSTAVGDVPWLLKDVDGCYLSDFSAQHVSECLNKALEFSMRQGYTKGRDKIISLGLDAEKVAANILSIYRQLLN